MVPVPAAARDQHLRGTRARRQTADRRRAWRKFRPTIAPAPPQQAISTSSGTRARRRTAGARRRLAKREFGPTIGRHRRSTDLHLARHTAPPTNGGFCGTGPRSADRD